MSTLQRAAFRKKGSKNQNRATNRPVHSTRRAGARGGKGGGGPLRGAEVARDGEGNRGRRGKRGNTGRTKGQN